MKSSLFYLRWYSSFLLITKIVSILLHLMCIGYLEVLMIDHLQLKNRHKNSLVLVPYYQKQI